MKLALCGGRGRFYLFKIRIFHHFESRCVTNDVSSPKYGVLWGVEEGGFNDAPVMRKRPYQLEGVINRGSKKIFYPF
ncbi:hypothetical protein CEXT_186131 [Caerostris extrusa]|uniref:Uncharacterized protein n=1 Tax=Caerostris extrusa TaxID=172846 RepID=A0AAV4TV40_CAEEX|nr:hypothetical protein CEXT_186131 [Caerostris extrusa]